MRINELNMFQNLLKGAGDTASNIFKQFKGPEAGPNQEKVDKMARDMYINKFISRGTEALNTAVKQKLVDPNSTTMGGSSGAAQPTQQSQGGAAPQSGGSTATPQPSQSGAAPQSGGAAAGGAASTTAPAAGSSSAPAGGAATTTAASPAGSPNAKSKSPGNAAVPAGGKQGQAKPQVDANVDKAVSAMRTFQPTGTKPLPQKFADELGKTIQNVRYNKDYLLLAADKINKFNAANYDVKDQYKNFMAQYQLGKKQQTIQESIEESRLEEIAHKLRSSERMQNALKKAGYDPDLAIRRMEDLLTKRRRAAAQRDRLVDLDEVSPQGGGRVAGAGLSQTPNAIRKRQKRAAAKAAATGQQPQAAPAAPQQRQAAPAAPPAAPAAQGSQPAASNPGKPSMGQWLKDNFIKGFFRGVPWDSAEQQIDDILTRLPAAYAKGNVKQELSDIAAIGWSLSPKRDE